MRVKIQRYTKLDSGSLKGIVQILFEDIGLTVNGVKIVESKKGGHFFAFPSEKYTDNETNEEKYREHCAFYIKGLYKDFFDSMNSAFKTFFKENPKEQDTHTDKMPQEQSIFEPTPQPVDFLSLLPETEGQNAQDEELPF